MHVKIYLVHCRTDSDGTNEFSLLFDKSRTKRSRHQWNNVSYCRFCLFFSYIEENLLIFQKQADFVGIIHNNFKSIIFKLILLVKQNGKTDYNVKELKKNISLECTDTVTLIQYISGIA